jgi:hypothetical protein
MLGKRVSLFILVVLATLTVSANALAQTTPTTKEAERIKTRDQLLQLLEKVGPNIKVTFRQSEKQPFNMVGVLRDGLTNAESYEIVVGVSTDQTIGFRVFPHYKGAYINLDKVRNANALMRQLMLFNDRNFLFWGADGSSDVFAGYTFTLESGFPEAAIIIVLRSIVNLDPYVGQMTPNIQVPVPVQ